MEEKEERVGGVSVPFKNLFGPFMPSHFCKASKIKKTALTFSPKLN